MKNRKPMENPQARSPAIITEDDLKQLLIIARKDIESFFLRHPKYNIYSGKECLITLGQGAALHYIDKKNGVKDFNVWFFFPRLDDIILPYRRVGKVDFGESKFGRHPDEQNFKGRRVDVLMRSDNHFNQGDPDQCLRNYLIDEMTTTANVLSKKAMIGLYPDQYFGKVLWEKGN